MDASSGNVTQKIPCVLVVRAAELGVELDGSLEVSRSVVSDQAIAIEELKYLAVQTIIGMVKTTEDEVRLQHVPVCCQQVHGLYVACMSPVRRLYEGRCCKESKRLESTATSCQVFPLAVHL